MYVKWSDEDKAYDNWVENERNDWKSNTICILCDICNLLKTHSPAYLASIPDHNIKNVLISFVHPDGDTSFAPEKIPFNNAFSYNYSHNPCLLIWAAIITVSPSVSASV